MNELDFNQLLLRNAEKKENTPIEPPQIACQSIKEVIKITPHWFMVFGHCVLFCQNFWCLSVQKK